MNTQRQIIGSVSSGTMREEDLIPRFMDALEELNPDKAKALMSEYAPMLERLDTDQLTEEDFEECSYLLNEVLFDALNAEAPAYFYFGSHPGDGADYGFWLGEDTAQEVRDNGGLVVSDTSEVPEDFDGEVLHVNDHGNCTLYSAQSGKLTEIWSVV